MIVTTDTTLVLNAERVSVEPLVQKFVLDLRRRLSRASGLAPVDEDADVDAPDAQASTYKPVGAHGMTTEAVDTAALAGGGERATEEEDAASLAMASDMPGSAREAQEAEIPYELRVCSTSNPKMCGEGVFRRLRPGVAGPKSAHAVQVLEVCLDHVARTMSDNVRELEEESKKRLDALAQRVTPANLDHVRRVKNRMVRQSTRVDTIRSLLERYLSDDADLAELHLSGQRCAPCDTSSPGSTSIPLRLRLAPWVDAGS